MLTERKIHIDANEFGYNLFKASLKTRNIKQGISNALGYIKTKLELNDILLYKQDEIGNYYILEHSGTPRAKRNVYNNVLNIEKKKLPDKGIEISLKGKKVKGLAIIPFLDKKYMLMIAHKKAIKKNDYQAVYGVLKEAIDIILNKREDIISSKKEIEEDTITNLGNRTAYEKKKEQYNSKLKNHITLALFDLFRLKAVNDEISHLAGDEYIKETGNILQKYFPMCREKETPDGNRIQEQTGDRLYRIGGDEYVLLSKHKSKEDLERIIPHIVSEVEDIELDSEKSYHTSLNYGVSERINREPIELLFREAEAGLLADKTAMYQRLGINRRR